MISIFSFQLWVYRGERLRAWPEPVRLQAFLKAESFTANSTSVFLGLKDGEESVFYKTGFLNSQLVSLHVLVKLEALENSWGFQLCWWLKNRVYSTSVIANMYGKVKTITYNRFKSWGPIKNPCSGFLDEFQSSLNEFHRSDQIRSDLQKSMLMT